MEERRIFPQISGLNWPSNLLPVWLALHQTGIPVKNLRFIPVLGRFGSPEVVIENDREDPDPNRPDMSFCHPDGPAYDVYSQTVTVHYEDPVRWKPRLNVHIRSEVRDFIVKLPDEEEPRQIERTVGRLAHFVDPLIAGLPQPSEDIDSSPTETGQKPPSFATETPMARLIRQVAEQYPELTETISEDTRKTLSELIEILDKGLSARDDDSRRECACEVANVPIALSDLIGYRTAFREIAQTLTIEPSSAPDTAGQEALERFQSLESILFVAHSDIRADRTERFFREETSPMLQKRFLLQFAQRLEWETVEVRLKVVRELMEIMTTEAFISVAMSDLLWGFSFAHGNYAEMTYEQEPLEYDGLFLSVMGGMHPRSILQSLLRNWLGDTGALGLRITAAGLEDTVDAPDLLNFAIFSESEREELLGLAAWRRETADPLILMEMAAQRTIHPDINVSFKKYRQVFSTLGTTLAQPMCSTQQGGAAVLGGYGKLLMPSVVIQVPLVERLDPETERIKARLAILQQLFLPVCFEVETIWQVGLASLAGASYLRHSFQQGISLARSGNPG